MINIEQLEMDYFQNDLSVPYKLRNKETPLLIHSIKVKDWHKVDDFALFEIKKNEVNNIDIIKMSYLQFLFEVYFSTYPDEKQALFKILSLCLHIDEDKMVYGYNLSKPVLGIINEDDVIEYFIIPKEFDEIMKIILHQNIYGYDRDGISIDMRKAIASYVAAQPKDKKQPTLSEKKIYVYSKKNITIQELNEMSYRIFTQVYDILFDCEEYLSTRIIQASEKFKVEREIIHPLFAQKKSIFEQVLGDKDSLIGEFNKVQ